MAPRRTSADRGDTDRLRLRADFDELRRKYEVMYAAHIVNDAKQLARLDATPIDVDKIRFTPSVVAAVVAAVISIIGGMYAATYGLRSDVRDILTRQEQRDRLEEVNRKLADQQTETLTKAVDVIDKRQQLQAIQIAELKEMVLKQGLGK